MVKSAETLEFAPLAQQSKITITVKALVPVMAYGNIAFEATQEIEFLHAEFGTEALERHTQTVAALELLNRSIAEMVLPMVEAEIVRYASILLKEANPSYWMSNNSPVYKWFRLTNPDIEIPGMQAILDSRSIPNSGLE